MRMESNMYKRFINEHYNELLDILNCLKVGVYITDGKGDTLFLNDESCRTGGLTREEVLGRNMQELEQMGFIENSVSLRVLKSGMQEELIQELGDGDKVYVTGIPLMRKGKIDVVICTERNITETLALKELLDKREDGDKVKKEAEYLRRQNVIMWGNMIAEDEESKRLAEMAGRIAGRDVTVLLTGESGTGKEVFANFIYQNSVRVGKPFIKINCTTIPENLMESELFGYEAGAFTGAEKTGKIGLVEMANGGTLFLDEVGDLPIHLQPKLLRVIQEREITRVGGREPISVDIRLIAATNKDLKEAVDRGTFRRDLYYRLNIMAIELLPLKGRKKDIKALALHFVKQFNAGYKMEKYITEDAIALLQQFDWPGNIRELENIIERIMISFDGNAITKFQVQRAIGFPVSENERGGGVTGGFNPERKSMEQLMDEYERYILESTFSESKRASDVARALRMNKSTLSRRVKKYHLEKNCKNETDE